MKMNKVDSSTIKTIGWECGETVGTGTLCIRFVKGGPKGYIYGNVPERIFHQLMNADISNKRIGDAQQSVGSLFHTLIKLHPDKYPFTNLDKQ